MNLRRITLAVCLLLASPACFHSAPTPPPSNVQSAPALGAAEGDRLSAIGANAEAAEFAATHIENVDVRSATLGPLGVIRSLAPGPYPDKARADAMALVVAALGGSLDKANQGWQAARTDAEAKTQAIAELRATVDRERAAAANELQRQLAEVRNEARQKAEAREKFFLTCLFSGGGTTLILLAIAVIALKAYVPMLGSQVALWLAVAGGTLISLGILVRAINRFIEDHPYIFWGTIAGAGLLIGGAAALVFANNYHHKHPAPVGLPA